MILDEHIKLLYDYLKALVEDSSVAKNQAVDCLVVPRGHVGKIATCWIICQRHQHHGGDC